MGKKALIFTAILIMVGLLVAGCGGSGGKNSSSAQKVLDEALKNLRALKSFKAVMKISQAASGSTPAQTSTVNIEVNNEGSGAMHSAMDYSGTKMEGYQIGDVTYTFVQGQGWQKQTGSKTDPINVKIADSLKTGVEDLKIQSQDASNYNLAFNWAEVTSTGSSASSTAPSSATQKFELKVDKKTMNIQQMVIKSVAAGSSSASAEKEVITFSDLNSPITITLPEEAKSAQETKSSSP